MCDLSDRTDLLFSAQVKLLLLVDYIQHLELMPWPQEGSQRAELAAGQAQQLSF